MGYEPRLYVLKEQFAKSWSEDFSSILSKTKLKNAIVFSKEHLGKFRLHITLGTNEMIIDEFEINDKVCLYLHSGKLTFAKIILTLLMGMFYIKRNYFLMNIKKVLFFMSDCVTTFDGALIQKPLNDIENTCRGAEFGKF